MILLLGASGYIGQAFASELEARKVPFFRLARSEVDYAKHEVLLRLLRELKPTFLINAAGYTGKPNVDACETARADALAGNTLLPVTISHACAVTGTPWGHISSGCIFNGAKVVEDDATRIATDMSKPELKLLAESSPERIRGFTEDDEPNFSFRHQPCSFYSGTKALAEEALCDSGLVQTYIWRLRIPFDECDSPRNYPAKLQRYPKIYDNVNSLSHRGDCVRACLDLWERRAPFGIYNVTNPGYVTARQVVKMIQQMLRPDREFEFWASDEEFYRLGAKTPRSNCVLDVSKLLQTGVQLRPVAEALENALRNWKPEHS